MWGGQVLVKQAGRGKGTAAFGESHDLQNQQALANGNGQNVPGNNIVARFGNLHAVQANVAGLDQALRQTPGSDHPGMPQPFV